MTRALSDIVNLPKTEKITLVHIEPVQRLLVWTLHSGAVYKRTVSNFVINIKEGTTSLSEGSGAVLSSGEWWFDSETNIVYLRTSDDSNPNTKDVSAVYRLFYSNSPLNLPYDLSSGADVEYQGRLKSSSPITQQLDDEQVGISLESSTSLAFHNEDGHFDDFFDILFFENKNVSVYIWSPLVPLSEKQLIFSGEIQDKSFSDSQVQFKCKDFIYKLRQPVGLSKFSASDGTVPDSYINTPKRRIYGKFDNLDCVPISAVLNGFDLTGTIAGTTGSAVLTGTGTSFLDECSPGDKLTIDLTTDVFEYEIDSVDSDTQITLTEVVSDSFTGVTVQDKPIRPYRKKNRTWFIADHKLRAPSTTVASATQPNRFVATDATDIETGDLIEVDGEEVYVKRVSGNDIVLETNLQGGTPSPGDTVVKNPLSKAYVNQNEAFVNRDWTLTNTTVAKIVFENDAEFNIAKPRSILGSVTFTNASRTVTATGVDFRNFVETRDWIRSDDITHTTWYEILSVEETTLYLRIAYAGGNNTGSAEIKNPDLIDENSLITVNCVGLERSGSWIKTASDVVKDLLEQDAGFTNTNAASFTQSDLEAPYVLSLAIPERLQGESPIMRDVIDKINKSVFGSLVNNNSFELVYNILTPEKPTDLTELKDDDIIGSIQVQSKNDVIRKVSLKYRQFIDRFTGDLAFKLSEQTSSFVDTYIGNKDELEITAYLYNTDDADEIAQRYLFYNSLSSSTVSVKAKWQFILKSLNDKVYLNLDRLYKRFGNRDRKKIGIISKITKSGDMTSVEFNDLGNIFNRAANIAADSTNEFSSATDTEKLVSGFICDDTLEIPDTTSDNEVGQNIIC